MLSYETSYDDDDLVDLLPAFFCLDRKPLSLADHRPFEPVFSARVPRTTVVVAGRQLGKSHQLSARIILQAALDPGHKTLVVLPLEQQADRMSSDIFKPMTMEGPVAAVLWAKRAKPLPVRSHRYDNGSVTHFIYATDDADRVRGLTGTRWLYIDESQDVDATVVPVLAACTDAWRYPTTLVSGTAKTKDTFLNDNWSASSQAVWHVKCSACGFDNICCLEPDGHVLAMIDTRPREDISEARPGTVCRKCMTPVNPRYGRWVHRYPERAPHVSGYHIPQVIMPMHFADPGKWQVLISKQNGGMGFTTGKFYNEVLGEPYDMALKLVSRDDLKAAAVAVGPNTLANAKKIRRRYRTAFLGVDWGGGGADGVSRTKVAVCGLHADGKLHVIYGYQFPPSTDMVPEAKEIIKVAHDLEVTGIAHDYNGAGTTAESVMTHLGWPEAQLVPFRYAEYPGADMITRKAAVGHRGRGYYELGKGKSLQFVCSAIRYDAVKFFDYDYIDEHRPGLLNDFVCLVSHNIDTPSGSVYRIKKQSASFSDDFAHAVNFAACAAWESAHAWPVLARATLIR